MKKITLFCFVSLLLICSCKNNDEPKGSTNPQIQHKLSLSNQETFYGTNVNTMQDPVSFRSDSLNRISEISYYVFKHTISYPNPNLITCHSDASNANAHIDETTNIYLENNAVNKICKKQINKYPDHTKFMESDSILFTYNSGNNLIRIDFFEKLSESYPYELKKVYEYTYENGNITKLTRTEYGVTTILNYSYDNKPNIDYGEYAPEMPLNFDYYYPLIYNKLGKRNTNNIIKTTYTYPVAPTATWNFDYTNYERILDSNGLITAIKISGQLISSDLKTTTTYNDGKVSFTYQ